MKNSREEIMFIFLNKADAYLNTKNRYVVKEEEHALEKKTLLLFLIRKRQLGKF